MTNRLTLDRVWASGGDRTDPGVDKYIEGWIDEIPTYQALNHIQYRNDSALLALAERGVFEWGTDIVYALGSLTWDEADGHIYVAIVDAPTGQPSLTPASWQRSAVQLTLKEYDEAQALLASHIANISNPHAVTAAQVDAYTIAEIDALIASNTGDIDAHIARVDDPHSVTAVQAGGVLASGGTYTGQVTFEAPETLINPGAGDAAISHIDGLYLRLAANKLGLNATGVPVFNASELIHEDNYATNRNIIEAQFSVPTPDCRLDLLCGINIPIGHGTTNYTIPAGIAYTDKSGTAQTTVLDTPAITADGLMTAPGYPLILDADLNQAGFAQTTIFLEFGLPTTTTVATRLWDDNSSSNDLLAIDIADGVYLLLTDSAGADHRFDIGTAVVGEVNKVAFTLDGINVKTYLNGVEGEGGAMSFAATSYTQVLLGSALVGEDTTYLRKFATWNSVLTLQQISTI